MKKVLIIIMLIIVSFFLKGCSDDLTTISDDEHYNNVKDIIEKKYLNTKYGFVDYELYPLYNENDVLDYFVVDFEPYMYFYIKINRNKIPGKGAADYAKIRCQPWVPYKMVYDKNDYKKVAFRDENNNIIMYNQSHFKVANITSERRYLLLCENNYGQFYVPAIKIGDNYLNLISMEEFAYLNGQVNDNVAVLDFGFDFFKYDSL